MHIKGLPENITVHKVLKGIHQGWKFFLYALPSPALPLPACLPTCLPSCVIMCCVNVLQLSHCYYSFFMPLQVANPEEAAMNF